MSKSLKYLFSILIIALTMPLAVASLTEITKYLGLRRIPVPVIGTGSMYPSLFWENSEGGPDDSEHRVVEEYRTTPMMYRRFPGIEILGSTYLHKAIQTGDMVTFQSSVTREILESEGKDTSSGFIKRVVALAGDTIELRDGYLYKNGELVEEPYIYRPRSSYGGETLADCHPLTIPDGYYFVMGDNRKTSSDSRGALGLVKDQDISYILPLSEQTLYRSLWRDPSQDETLLGTPTLDAKEFYSLVNQVRKEAGLSSLTPKPALQNSAKYKGQEILAGNPDYPLSSALKKSGYHNIKTSEFSIRGRYTAQELLTNILYFDSTKKQLLDPQYTDIGIYDLNGQQDSCPTEVVVAHLGGYVPASYDQNTIDSWKNLRDNLAEIIPSWEKARGYSQLDQGKLEELLEIFHRRLTLSQELVRAMENSEWLSESQEARIQSDQKDSLRSQQLSSELNQK